MTVGLRSTYRRYRFLQKFICSDESWRVCKQAKLSHLGHRKPTRVHWKADAPRTSLIFGAAFSQEAELGRFSSKMSKERTFQSMAIVIGPCWTNFCSEKLKRRILATFCFNKTALRVTPPKLHPMICALFLKIVISAAELMLFGHLGVAIWLRWTIICGVPSKISVTPTS